MPVCPNVFVPRSNEAATMSSSSSAIATYSVLHLLGHALLRDAVLERTVEPRQMVFAMRMHGSATPFDRMTSKGSCST